MGREGRDEVPNWMDKLRKDLEINGQAVLSVEKRDQTMMKLKMRRRTRPSPAWSLQFCE